VASLSLFQIESVRHRSWSSGNLRRGSSSLSKCTRVWPYLAMHAGVGEYYQQLEDQVVRRLKGTNIFKMKAAHTNMSDLRFQLSLSTFTAQISFLKVRQFAHWLRGESIAGEVIRGMFIPEKTIGSTADDVDDIAYAGISLRAHRGRRTYLEEQFLHLERDCCIPQYAISTLASDNSPLAKRTFYVLTREAFIREVLRDWSCGNGVTELEVEERRKDLCMKYQIDNRNLDSHLTFFRPGFCAACDMVGFGSEETRALHYHLWHELGLRGQEYVDRFEIEKARKEEEYGWEKKCRLADIRRKDLIQKREEDFFRLNEEKVSIVEPKGVKTLGTYRCKLCEEDYTTPVDAMDRHLATHETKNVAKVYKHTPKYLPKKSSTRQKITKQPAEHRYWCKGAYSAGNNTKLFRLKIDKVAYEEGSKWKCQHCGLEFQWERGASGAKVHVLAKNIEFHLRGIQTHGSCEKARESRSKRRAEAEKRKKGRGKGNTRKNNRVKSRNSAKVFLRVGGKSIGSAFGSRWSSRV
jgi:hypothetical protein